MGNFSGIPIIGGIADALKSAKPGWLSGALQTLSPAIPIVGGIAQNILEGINTRKARLYDSPANQIKRRLEAGMPMASASNITSGQAFQTKTADLGTSQLPQNIRTHVGTSLDRKQLQIMQEELHQKHADAMVAANLAKNKLNPTGQYTPNNAGFGYSQELGAQALGIKAQEAAIKTQNIVNSFMPAEKGLGLANTSSDIANKLAQNKIYLNEGKIKEIQAKYQEGMSSEGLRGLILSNAGQYTSNQRSEIQREIENTGKQATMSMNQWQSTMTSEELKSRIFTNSNIQKQFASYDQWFDMKKKVDEATRNKFLWSPADVKAFIYTLLYQPTPSSGNINPIGTIVPFIK